MCITCLLSRAMPKMIQVRNVPDDLHRELKQRAERAGMSLSDYLQRLLERAVERATPEEMRERLEGRAPVDPPESSPDALRAGREDSS